MPPIYTRFRERTTLNPDLVSGLITCGTFSRFINNEWVPLSVPYSVAPNQDYFKIEVCKDNIHTGPPWTSGGDFATLKVVQPDTSRVQGWGTRDTGTNIVCDFTGCRPWRYEGGFTNPQFDGDGYAPNFFSMGNVETLLRTNVLFPSTGDFGPEAYARMRPKLENANVMVDLAESRDIPRMLKRTSAEFHTLWGDYYRSQTFGGRLLRVPNRGDINWRQPPEIGASFLNLQFGWSPFIKSLKDIGDTYNRSQELINQIKKNNNVWIKRKWVKDETSESTLLLSGTGLRCEPQGNTINQMCVNGLPPGSWELYRDVITRVYAVGRFKYYRPEFDESVPSHHSMWDTVQRYLTIYGARINPSNVYKATPWSWAIDYFSNLGDLVDQINDLAVDGIVTKYMYLMHTQTVRIRLEQRINFQAGPVNLSWSKNILTKQREGAGSPFDFRLTLPLTAKQLAVLGALGATRTSPSTWKFAR